jgi:hypothetical protein
MTTDNRPSLPQIFLMGIGAAVPRKRLFGGDYYEQGVVSMLATNGEHCWDWLAKSTGASSRHFCCPSSR